MTKAGGLVAALLGIGLVSLALAGLGEVRVPSGGAHHVWPIHSDYVLPLMLMIWTYTFIGAGLALAVVYALSHRP